MLQLFEERWSSPPSSQRQAVLKGDHKRITETELGLLHDAAVRDDSKMIRHIYKLDKSALGCQSGMGERPCMMLPWWEVVMQSLHCSILDQIPPSGTLMASNPFSWLTNSHEDTFASGPVTMIKRYAVLFDEALISTNQDSSSSEEEADSDHAPHAPPTSLGSRESRKLAQALSIISKHSSEIKPVKRKPGRPRKYPLDDQ